MRDRAFAGDFVALVHRRDSAQLARSLAAGLARSAGNVPAVLLEDPRGRRVVGPLLSRLLPPLRNLSRSDHAVFWSLGVPAVMVTDSANFRTPHYHRPTDTAEKLDYRILASVVNATADAVAEHAGFLA
jgi:Zn-dependent M28 family amino/carboxypeptidase